MFYLACMWISTPLVGILLLVLNKVGADSSSLLTKKKKKKKLTNSPYHSGHQPSLGLFLIMDSSPCPSECEFLSARVGMPQGSGSYQTKRNVPTPH